MDGERSARATTRALRRSRRRHYLTESDWVDSLYKAYVTVIIAALALFYLTVTLGNTTVDAGTITTIRERAPGVLGLGIAAIVALGLRSGAHGGPLAPEPADVMYLLLAPIPRATVLRAAAARQLRGVVLVPAIAGGVAGSVTAGRLGGDRAGWIAAGVAAGALVALTAWARPSSRRAPRCPCDAPTRSRCSSSRGRSSTWPPVVAPHRPRSLPGSRSFRSPGHGSHSWAVGSRWSSRPSDSRAAGNVALEPLGRRARLVSELRFAATLQDMRSVIVLHRELAQELPRSRPWWQARAATAAPAAPVPAGNGTGAVSLGGRSGA